MYEILLFIVGVSVGSFLNVAIFRIHKGESITRGRSKCMSCEEPIGWLDLIPVLSYLHLRGRCRRCKNVISAQYPIVEAFTGILFVLAFTILESQDFSIALLVRNLVFISYLIIIFVYDLRHMLIIDRFTIPAMIFALMANLYLGAIPTWSLLAGAAVLAGFFFVQYVISKGVWIGGGDIRLGALMGFMLGLEQGLLALFLGYVFGAIVGTFLLISKKVEPKTQVPMGTFLSLSTLITLFYGNEILHWYLLFFLK